ncbi:NADH-ubiquinone oxidoreductase 9.5 kDa subunit, partial [Phyllosticta citribraziliensis]
MSKPYFWAEPVRYMRWAFHEKPAITWSLVLGGTAPIIPIAAPPIRRFFGDEPGRPMIPHNYPSESSTTGAPSSIPNRRRAGGDDTELRICGRDDQSSEEQVQRCN